MRLDDYIARLNVVIKNPDDWFFKIVKGREQYVLAIPRRRLSLMGTDANDKLITPKYADKTIKNKQRKGQRTKNVTLKDTGKLHQSFELIKENGAIDFKADAPYLFKLQEHYDGNELIGFSPKDNEQIFKLFILPELEELINQDIDLEF